MINRSSPANLRSNASNTLTSKRTYLGYEARDEVKRIEVVVKRSFPLGKKTVKHLEFQNSHGRTVNTVFLANLLKDLNKDRKALGLPEFETVPQLEKAVLAQVKAPRESDGKVFLKEDVPQTQAQPVRVASEEDLSAMHEDPLGQIDTLGEMVESALSETEPPAKTSEAPSPESSIRNFVMRDGKIEFREPKEYRK